MIVVVPKADKAPTHGEITRFLDGKISKWWMPDDTVLTDELPIGATGKVLKARLREQFGDHKLPNNN